MLLMGTSRCADNSDLPEVPSVQRTIDDFRDALTEQCGIPLEKITTLIDPKDPMEMGLEISRVAQQAEDVFFVYFVGHGLVSSAGRLHLATRATNLQPDQLPHTSLPYETVRTSVLGSPAQSIVVVLDCCFSGHAVEALGPAKGVADIHGAYVLTSAARDQLALAPKGATHTAFTGELIRLLKQGDPRVHHQLLTLGDAYHYLRRVLPARGFPEPHQRASDQIQRLVLAPNPAYSGGDDTRDGLGEAKPPPQPPWWQVNLDRLRVPAGRMWPAIRRFIRPRYLVPAVVVLIVAGLFVWRPWERCGTGVRKVGDECVGVTDGSYVFSDDLRDVEGRILAENKGIANESSVTVALLMPFTSDGTVSAGQIRAAVEGAYTAQHQANAGQSNPKIRLVLANEGSEERDWQLVVNQLGGMVKDSQPLRAVTGLGVSSQATVDGAKSLSAMGIPMVGAVITADSLDSTGFGGIPGLARVSPSNSAEVAALADYLHQQRPDLQRALLVFDESKQDFYTSGLRNDFQSQLPDKLDLNLSPPQPFDGTPGTPGIANQFNTIAGQLCGPNPPDMVFYAGRSSLLPEFITRLNAQECSRHVTVVTGSDAASLPQAPLVPVVYAALADRQELSGLQNPDASQFRQFENAFPFNQDDLGNGWATMTHDAMLAATTAIGNATGQDPQPPDLNSVRGSLFQLNNDRNAVAGAAGRFKINQDTGEPIDHRLAVMRWDNGHLTVGRVEG